MGTWDIDIFDDVVAADFAGELDRATMEERGEVVFSALELAASCADYMNRTEAVRAVAAAALVAAQYPGGEPVSSRCGPSEPMPEFDPDLRILADDAVNQVLADEDVNPEIWGEAADGRKWHRVIARLRAVLVPPTSPAC